MLCSHSRAEGGETGRPEGEMPAVSQKAGFLKRSRGTEQRGVGDGLDSFQTGAEDSNWFVSSLQTLKDSKGTD